MKSFVIFLAFLLPSLVLAWQEEKPFLSKDFNASGIKELKLETGGLSVNIASWSEDRVLIEVFALRDNKVLSPNDAQLRKKLEDLEFDMRQEGEKVSLRVEQAKRTGIKMSRDNIVLLIKIQTPTGMSSNILSAGGAVTLAGLEGNQQIQSNGGSVRFIQGKGKIQGETLGGSILMDNFTGDLNLSSMGGSVRLENFSGNLDVKSAGGSLNLFDMSGKITAETAGGSIRASFREPLESVHLASKGGAIEASLPQGLGMSVLFKGSIVVSQHQKFEGESRKTLVKGTINGGGIPVVFETSGANVRVDYR
jgi:DUF4097 and DUF4098 domain-containing protein YvlB